MILTQTEKQISTILPDGSAIQTSVAPWSDGLHRIGELKRINLEYTTDESIEGYCFYINPALFIPESLPNPFVNKPNYYYQVQLPSVLGSGVEYPALLGSIAIDPFLNTYQNTRVLVIPDGGNLFQIVVEFYMVHDMTTYMGYNGNTQVYKKFTNDVYYHAPLTPNNSNLGATDTGSPNIYATTNISPRVYFYMEKPGTNPLEKASKEERFDGLRAGYYYKNKTNTSPWFTNTYISFERGGQPVTNLSSTAETDGTIHANTDSDLSPVTHFVVRIFRLDLNNLNQDFVVATEMESQIIESSNTSTTKLRAPMSNPIENSPQEWIATFKVAPLPFGQVYRFIGIAYSSVIGQPLRVNSYITGEMVADALPTFDGQGFDALGALDDYNKQFDGNDLECCIEERMRAKLKLYFPFDKWKNDIFNRLGLVVTNDIRRYLTGVYFNIYDTNVNGFGTVQNIYDYKASTKVGLNTYSPQNGLTMNFSNTWAEFTYEFRNRFESYTPCVGTLVNGVPYLPVQGVQYWGGKTLTIKWVLRFSYDNYSIPFEEDVVFFQQIRVKDYGQMSISGYDTERNDFYKGDFVCNNDEICFAAILQNPSLTDRKLITNIYPLGASVDNVEEAEVWEGFQLPQLTTDKIIDQDENYSVIASETAAKFCVDGSKLLVNSQYVISGLAKKFVETDKRIVEPIQERTTPIIEPRITEENDRRITDNT